MDWLPDLNYWAVICGFLVALNIWQYARAHSLSTMLAHIHLFGHAPDGKAIVPAASVTAGPSTAQTITSKEGYL